MIFLVFILATIVGLLLWWFDGSDYTPTPTIINIKPEDCEPVPQRPAPVFTKNWPDLS